MSEKPTVEKLLDILEKLYDIYENSDSEIEVTTESGWQICELKGRDFRIPDDLDAEIVAILNKWRPVQ